MAIKRRVVVGVFDEPAMADNAVNALQNAGFVLQQIVVASHYSETEERRAGGPPTAAHHKSLGTSFVDGLKQLFTGKDVSETDATSTDIEGDLTGMGLSDDAARYYEDQYKAGRSVVGVRAEDREDDALSILRSNGGHDFDRRPGGMRGETARPTGDYGRNAGVNRPTQPAQPGTMPPPATGTTGMPEMQPRTSTTGPTSGYPSAESMNMPQAGATGQAGQADIDRTGTANPMRSRDVNAPQPVTGVDNERERMRMEQEGGPARRDERERDTQTDTGMRGTRETQGPDMPSEQEAQRARERLENEYERRTREQPESERDIETDL